MMYCVSAIFGLLDLILMARIAHLAIHYRLHPVEKVIKALFMVALGYHCSYQYEALFSSPPPTPGTLSWVPLMAMMHLNSHLYMRVRAKQLPQR